MPFSQTGTNKAVNKNRFHRWIDGGGTSPATYAVVCGDADPIGGRKDLRKLRELAQEVKNISSIEGESWSLSHYGHCLDWKFQAYERFTGPWERIQTRFPIIYLSNTHDPVTPLASGKAMTEVFGNSSATLLIQNGSVLSLF
ncbi:hypothetical protein BT69DRAFT_1328868 [Atractiella rhizophila]|nr:hypothetical protein BT69DRAFT_1328868 [Atractiella rhizophila]